MRIAAAVADANVLLSAVIGKAALRVFMEFDLSVHIAAFNAEEVMEYIPHMAAKYDLPVMLAQVQWRLLNVQMHSEEEYAKNLEWARSRLAKRDLDDVHPLALARTLRLPLWSNDKDFSGLGTEILSTARLLKALEVQTRPRQ